MVFHEFAHTLIGQAILATNVVEEMADWDGRMTYRSWFPTMYTTWSHRWQEIAVRAMTILYHEHLTGRYDAPALIAKEQAEFGITLIAPIYRCFKAYYAARNEGMSQGFFEYITRLPNLLKADTA